MAKTTRQSNARQRIIETAERLFYAEGIRAVGIDRIIAEAQVAKMTLYNHFASKDDLILAVLQFRDLRITEMFTESIDHYVARGMDRLPAFFATLKDWFESPGFRGCSFINAAVELADMQHPAAKFAWEHKQRMHEQLRELVIEAAGKTSAELAPSICLLVEGAIVMAVMEQTSRPADVARDAALRWTSRSARKKS